jgi:hypothetical protein
MVDRSVYNVQSQMRFSMEKEVAFCFAEIQGVLAEYACAGREFTMRPAELAKSSRLKNLLSHGRSIL